MIHKLFAVAAATGIILSLAGSAPAHEDKKERQPGEKVERTMPVDAHATITLCVSSGSLTVRGWDKTDVRVRSADAAHLDFRRIDKPKDPATPAMRVDVMVLDKTTRVNPKLDCQAIADVDMDVPTGATVQVQTRDGDIKIAGVAAVYAGSQNGDITIERAVTLVEAGSVGGSIFLSDSSGRVNLSSAGGGVQATNVRGMAADDTFEVGTVSGDIQLERIGSRRVLAKTVSGTLKLSGALVKSGSYAFTNMTGDVVLELAHDASFRLSAKVNEKKDIVSEFPLTYVSETGSTPPPPPPPKEKAKPVVKEKVPNVGTVVVGPVVVAKPAVIVPYVRRFEAVCGSGDASISVASFGGTLQLKKL